MSRRVSRLRTASARRLAVIGSSAVALAVTAGIAQGALGGGGPVPPPKALAAALLAAFDAPAPDGVTARIELTNDLLPSGALPRHAASPLLSGADGRLWIQQDGDVRIELQSNAGDVQIVAAGDRLTVYDAGSQTLYRARLPRDRGGARDHGDHELTLAKVQDVLDRLGRAWSLSGAEPGSIASRPAYTLTVTPRERGGLLGAAAVAWDAVRGAPLRAALYARGRSEPVLELEVTDISYGAVADTDVRVAPPPSAEVVDLGSEEREQGTQRRGRRFFAPATLAGIPRTHLSPRGALAIYGEGLGAIAVLQRPAGQDAGDAPGEARRSLRLPRIDVGGARGTELATALGTVITFRRDGVAYVVAGSVPPATAEKAARGLR